MKKIALITLFLSIASFCFGQPGMHKKSHFALVTPYLNEDENPEIQIYPNIGMAMQQAGDASAVIVSPSDQNLFKIGQLPNLRAIYFDRNFTYDNYYLDHNGMAKFFRMLSGLQNGLYISMSDAKLLPLVADLPNLKGLYLRSFDAMTFTKVADKLSQKLEVLVIDDATCTFLPQSLSRLTVLKQLEVYPQGLGSFPDSIGYLSNLKVMKIDGGGFDHVPPSFANLSNLQYLYLDGGPKSPQFLFPISHIQSLVEIDLNIMGLETLPDTIGSLTNLTKLYLGDATKLKDITLAVANMKGLKEVYLGQTTHLVSLGGLDSLDHKYTLLLNPVPTSKLLQAIAASKNIETVGVPDIIKDKDLEKLKKDLAGKMVVKKSL